MANEFEQQGTFDEFIGDLEANPVIQELSLVEKKPEPSILEKGFATLTSVSQGTIDLANNIITNVAAQKDNVIAIGEIIRSFDRDEREEAQIKTIDQLKKEQEILKASLVQAKQQNQEAANFLQTELAKKERAIGLAGGGFSVSSNTLLLVGGGLALLLLLRR
ncbi:hypothetical protein [Candidatus Uabimicrobium amorphum]|uniref:Uncharacterized protein n=1 Tax=Uabimicrobium amorphum TaxID=2596890 RepID=A0A5S9IM68_UABAM|nr:hypothetical protein [Candidatus Uabimicrobium amorphum]BBM84439.1 hypothetical protein UABAM_02799 [Candidatus Uabimicrobium amorphum]